jgi:hypothetical protein
MRTVNIVSFIRERILTGCRQTKVANSHIECAVNEDIFGLEITMYNVQAMNMNESL